MQIIDGQLVASILKKSLKEKVEYRVQLGHRPPHLCAILIGEDPASHAYINYKIMACAEVGFKSSLLKFDNQVSEEFILDKISEINSDGQIDGLIVQLPLPKRISVNKIIEHTDPNKDVDGFHPINIGRMVKGIDAVLPATPAGILLLLEHYDIKTEGKNCVVIGRSQIVGGPMAILMSLNHKLGNATVVHCHSKTKNLKELTLQADIIISAVGRPKLITADMVKEGVVIIDVGTTRVKDETKKSGFSLSGDVDFINVAPKCQYITPVPKGVGPMTIASLLNNTLLLANKRLGLSLPSKI
ncbi:MAG: tetrahydrofolate dehydrogenase/cyclohydrolase catalytic domain-containing protein [Bacteroidota bacterium]|nr:tetrahydrofolate dehydrogenase/cyclohydrolase catalytic domain-containing protein [Bacteroidota bacterium]